VGVSVIIPCLNEEKYIKDCLESLTNNGFSQSDMELLVVDGGSSDGTLQIIELLQKEYDFIRVISNPKKRTPFALNLGIQNATKGYILIAGAHAVYPKHYIEKLYNLIQKPEIDVAGGSIETKVKNRNTKTDAIKFVLSHKFGVGNSMFRVGAKELLEVDTVPFGLYKKEVFDKAGIYNEKLIRNHDIELSRRIQHNGFHIWMEPELRVTYFARETFSGLARNNYGNGFWNLRTLYITKQFKSLSLRHYIPLFFILSLLLPIILGLFTSSLFCFVSLASLLAYISVIFYLSLVNIAKYHPIFLFWSFITLHFSYGIGSLMGLLSIFNIRNR